jgi:hypothetical protein
MRLRAAFHDALRAALLAFVLVLAGCATAPQFARPPAPAQSTAALGVLRSVSVDPALEDRILALDPGRISEKDVATLAAGPTPRIMLLHGGIYPVHLVMESFGEFLVGMGYPEEKIRDPATGEWSRTPYDTTQRLAGMVAWYYEHDGMRPMLIGHSQGGLYVVKILKELAGQNADAVPMWNPITDMPESRTTLVDPLTGRERPVVGTSVSYASAVGAGGWALVLPNQWTSFTTLRKIPDSAEEFTGYFISVDLFALSFPGNPLDTRYEGVGNVDVRNVMLPAEYNHVTVPSTRELAQDAMVRGWINAYVPGDGRDPSGLPGDASSHVLWAADVWFSIKKHWCREAQRLIRARRSALASN